MAKARALKLCTKGDYIKCRGVGNFAPFLPLYWLSWQRPLRNRKKLDPSRNLRRYLPFGEKLVKIGPVDTEIALLVVKKVKKKRRN